MLNLMKKLMKVRFWAGICAVGLLFTILSCVIIAAPKAETIQVEGTIVSISAYRDAGGEEQHEVLVTFTDRSGVKHANIPYPSYSSSMHEGDTVTVLYHADDPESIDSPGSKWIPYVFLAIGVCAAAVSAPKVVKAIKTPAAEMDQMNRVDMRSADPAEVEKLRSSTEPMADYYFHFCGKMNQSYILETTGRTPVFEAICDKIGVATPFTFTFLDHSTGLGTAHQVSHTVTTRYGNGAGFSLPTSSALKIDGKETWDILAENGYSLTHHIDGIKLNFSLMHYGVKVAELTAAGTNILRDDPGSALGDKLPGTGLYKVSCRPSEVPMVFLACFTVSRVEFF